MLRGRLGRCLCQGQTLGGLQAESWLEHPLLDLQHHISLHLSKRRCSDAVAHMLHEDTLRKQTCLLSVHILVEWYRGCLRSKNKQCAPMNMSWHGAQDRVHCGIV